MSPFWPNWSGPSTTKVASFSCYSLASAWRSFLPHAAQNHCLNGCIFIVLTGIRGAGSPTRRSTSTWSYEGACAPNAAPNDRMLRSLSALPPALRPLSACSRMKQFTHPTLLFLTEEDDVRPPRPVRPLQSLPSWSSCKACRFPLIRTSSVLRKEQQWLSRLCS